MLTPCPVVASEISASTSVSPAASTAWLIARPQGTPRASPDSLPPVSATPLATPGATTVSGPSGMSIPARPSSRRASTVSPSGTGSAWYADRPTSAMLSAKPRSPSVTSPMAVMPCSSSAAHSLSGHRPLAIGRHPRIDVERIVHDPVEGPQHQVARLAHLRPSPRAMMPRRISRVPPRSE